jgi:hypothetical protein
MRRTSELQASPSKNNVSGLFRTDITTSPMEAESSNHVSLAPLKFSATSNRRDAKTVSAYASMSPATINGRLTGPLLPKRCIEQVCQSNPSPLQPFPNEGHVLLEVCNVDHHDLLVLTHRECLIPLLIDALGADSDAVAYGLAPSDLKGLIRPSH